MVLQGFVLQEAVASMQQQRQVWRHFSSTVWSNRLSPQYRSIDCRRRKRRFVAFFSTSSIVDRRSRYDEDLSPTSSRSYRLKMEHMIDEAKELLAIPTSSIYDDFVDLHHRQVQSFLGKTIQSYTSADAILPTPEAPKRSSLSISESLMEPPSFYQEQFEQSKEILQSVIQSPQRRNDPDNAQTSSSSLPSLFDAVKQPWTCELINLSFQLHHRVITEYTLLNLYAERFPDDSAQHHCIDPQVFAHRTYFTNIRHWNRLLNVWKDVALKSRASPTRSKALPSVRQVMDHTLYMAALFPSGSTTFPFRFDIGTIGILLQVLIPQLPSKFSAPLDVEEFVNSLLVAAERVHSLDHRQRKMLRCDAYVYSILMKTWADSGRPETSERLVALLQQMRVQGVPRNAIIYSIHLRYYGGCGDVDQVRSLLLRMERMEGIPPTLACYGQAVFCLAKADQWTDARRLLDRMIDMRTNDARSTSLIVSAAHNILDAYRRSLDAYGGQSSARGEQWDSHVQVTIALAAAVVRRLESAGVLVLDEKFGDSIRGTLMDIYARSGTEEHLAETQRLFQKIVQPDTISYGILIKAFRKNHRANLADATLQKLLQDARVPNLSINIFNSVIHAWAESSFPNAIQNGLNIMHIIKSMNKHNMIHCNPKSLPTMTKEILPNADTYNALLKCLAEAGDGVTFPLDVGRKAEDLILEMERRYNGGDDEGDVEVLDVSCQPTVYTYTTGIRACLRVNDFDHAESILRRMELSSTTTPDTSIYNTILNHYANVCHDNVVKLATNDCTEERSDIIATKASVTALTIKAAERATRILKYMILSKDPLMQPDMVSYNRVFQCWAKSNHEDAVQEIWDIYQAFRRPKRSRNDEETVPNYMNSVCYDTMISFFTRESSDEDAIYKALLLLKSMEASHKSDLRPDGWHYSAIIKGFLRLGLSGLASTTLIHAMKQPKSPAMNTIPALLHSVVLSWIEQEQLEAASRYLDGVFDILEHGHSNPSVPSNGTDVVGIAQWDLMDTFAALQAAWRDSRHPDKDAFIATIEEQIATLPCLTGVKLQGASKPASVSMQLHEHYEILPTMNN